MGVNKGHLMLWAESDEEFINRSTSPSDEVKRLKKKLKDVSDCVDVTVEAIKRHTNRLERLEAEIERLEHELEIPA